MAKARPMLLDTVMFLDGGYPIESISTVCLKNDRPVPNMYSGKHMWRVPKIESLCKAFKNVIGSNFKGNFKNTHKQIEYNKLKELLCIQ